MRLVAPRSLVVLVLLLPLRAGALVSFSTEQQDDTEPIGVSNPQAVTLADVDGDNVDDLITVTDLDAVAVYLNDGDGALELNAEYDTVDEAPVAVVTGLFNDDNFRDIAVANTVSGTVSVLLGLGDGTFDEEEDPFRVRVGDDPIGIGVGDINNDREEDLLVLSPNLVYVLQGNGDGTFSAGNPATIQTRSTTASSFAIAVGFLDSDTNLDYAVTNGADAQIVTFFGNGNGTFTLGQFVVTGDAPTGLIIADADGDTDNDLMAVDSGALPFDEVRLMRNNGDPDDAFLFDAPESIVAGEGPWAITGLNVDPGDTVDIAVTTLMVGEMSLLCQPSDFCDTREGEPLEPAFGQGGIYRQPRAGTVPGCTEEGQVAVVSGKLNGDDLDDLVALSGDLDTLCISLNTSRTGEPTTPGTVTATPTGPTPTPTETRTLTPSPTATEVPTIGLGVCHTGEPGALPGVNLGRPVAVAVADFDRDGDRDVAVADAMMNRIFVLETNLDPAAMPDMPCNALGLEFGAVVNDVLVPEKLIAADLDLDGSADLAVIGQQGLSIFYGNGSGGFSPSAANPIAAGSDPSALATADFNRDLTPDIVVSDLGSQNASMFIGTRMHDQPFNSRCALPVGRTTNLVIAADLNADARADFAVTGQVARDIGVFLQRQDAPLTCGNVAFQGQDPPSVPNEPVGIVAGLFTSTDNIPDLVVAMRVPSGNGAVLLYEGRATSGNGVTYQSGSAVPIPTPAGTPVPARPTDIGSGDIERDGRIDLLITDGQNDTLAEFRGQASGGIGVGLNTLPVEGDGPVDLEVIDLDGDGRDDVIVANAANGTVSYLLSNQREATPVPPNTPTATQTPPPSATRPETPTISPTTTRSRRPSPSQTPEPTHTQRGLVSLSDNGCAIDAESGDSGAMLLGGFGLLALIARRRALALLGG